MRQEFGEALGKSFNDLLATSGDSVHLALLLGRSLGVAFLGSPYGFNNIGVRGMTEERHVIIYLHHAIYPIH